MDFSNLGLHESLIEALKKAGITTPTNIQEAAIPLILQNKDVIGQSETGTGKTLAYLLPICARIDPAKREIQAIILTPTHELAIQVQREIETLAQNSGIEFKATPIIGNVNIQRQIEALKAKPQIVVGSPGRILELITLRKLKAHTVKTIVIDEADRLLDPTNLEVVEALIKTTLRDRQLLLFSATIPEQTVQTAQRLMKEPELLRVESNIPVLENISHMFFAADQRDKIEVLRKAYGILKPEKAIVFINTSYEIEKTVERLNYHGLNAAGTHGDSSKQDRKKVMDNFRTGKMPILVASDLAARGLDIEGVTHIFNLDLPEDPKLYLHRAGRTGRAGKSGYVISIVNEYEHRFINKYEQAFNITIAAKDMYAGKLVDARPARNKQMAKPKPAGEQPRHKPQRKTNLSKAPRK